LGIVDRNRREPARQDLATGFATDAFCKVGEEAQARLAAGASEKELQSFLEEIRDGTPRQNGIMSRAQ
jgi:hypothetical protein